MCACTCVSSTVGLGVGAVCACECICICVCVCIHVNICRVSHLYLILSRHCGNCNIHTQSRCVSPSPLHSLHRLNLLYPPSTPPTPPPPKKINNKTCEGCYKEMKKHLSQVVPLVMRLLNDEHARVRWAVSLVSGLPTCVVSHTMMCKCLYVLNIYVYTYIYIYTCVCVYTYIYI